MYKVIKSFEDLQDNRHKYNVNDTYPRDGKEVIDSRLMELSTGNNKRGVPLIAKQEPMPIQPGPLQEPAASGKPGPKK